MGERENQGTRALTPVGWLIDKVQNRKKEKKERKQSDGQEKGVIR